MKPRRRAVSRVDQGMQNGYVSAGNPVPRFRHAKMGCGFLPSVA